MSTEKENVFYVNGEWLRQSEAKISVLDFGLAYGDGVFEGIAIYGGKIFKLDEHLDRLLNSLRFVKIQSPATREELKKLAIDFVRKNELVDAHFKIMITRGQGYVTMAKADGKPSLIIFGVPVKSFNQEKTEGIRLKTSALRKPPPECLDARVKTLNYMNSILNKLDAYAFGANDGLVLDLQGFVAEAPAGNFFIVKNGTVKTPTPYNALEGITRATLIELAKGAGYTVLEENMTLYDVYSADEAFLCGTLIEVVPVAEVDGRMIGSSPRGPVTMRLQQLFREQTRRDGPWLTKTH
jgi:branched-chain amino acid aminotransferase